MEIIFTLIVNDPERFSRPMWKEKSLRTNLEKKEVWNMVWEKQIALFEYSSRYVFCKKVPQTEICGLTVLPGRSLKSECWQGGFLPGAGTESLFPVSLQASGSCQQSLGSLTRGCIPSTLCLHLHGPLPVCVSKFLLFMRTPDILAWGPP